jgi:Mce-associated membrane protein
MNPYDLLDVDRDASDDEIRAAWKAAIADLSPGDRRFRAYNQAAEVLLDPASRAAYDAELAAEEPEPEPELAAAAAPVTGRPTPAVATTTTAGTPERSGGGVPLWLLIGVAVLAAAMIAATAYVWTRPSDESVEEATRTAQSAAERAIVPILSYDAATLDEDQEAAHAYMTSDYRKNDYDPLFEVLRDNAPATGTKVEAEVIASGIVRSGEDRVDVLLFVNRPTTNKQQKEPVIYKDQVTVTMEKVGDDWLVDDMVTSPVAK